MFSIEVDTSGFENLAKTLQNAVNNMSQNLSSLNAEITKDIKGKLEERTPVRTGYMKAHWFIEGVNKIQIDLRDWAEYSSFVDLGTSKMAARHVTQRAFWAFEIESKDWLEREVAKWLQ